MNQSMLQTREVGGAAKEVAGIIVKVVLFEAAASWVDICPNNLTVMSPVSGAKVL
jgi:hypothetical protein